MNRKGINAGVIFALALAVLAFGIMGIILVVGQTIIVGIQGTTSAGTTAYYITQNTSSGLFNISQQLPLLGTILIFGAVISLLLAVFWFKGQGGM